MSPHLSERVSGPQHKCHHTHKVGTAIRKPPWRRECSKLVCHPEHQAKYLDNRTQKALPIFCFFLCAQCWLALFYPYLFLNTEINSINQGSFSKPPSHLSLASLWYWQVILRYWQASRPPRLLVACSQAVSWVFFLIFRFLSIYYLINMAPLSLLLGSVTYSPIPTTWLHETHQVHQQNQRTSSYHLLLPDIVAYQGNVRWWNGNKSGPLWTSDKIMEKGRLKALGGG